MDRRRFDAWINRLPGASPGESPRSTSRRRVLRSAAGGALVATAGLGDTQAAAGEGVCGSGCGSLCAPVPSQLLCNFKNTDCLCMQSTSGVVHCVDGASAVCPPVGAPNDCKRDQDCVAQGLGDFCIRTAGSPCCSDPTTQAQVNICVSSCLYLTTVGRARRAGSLLAGVGGQL
jgi:hypothetical protein